MSIFAVAVQPALLDDQPEPTQPVPWPERQDGDTRVSWASSAVAASSSSTRSATATVEQPGLSGAAIRFTRTQTCSQTRQAARLVVGRSRQRLL
jgi:hypothetical protein